jgi:hypothetical protein
MARNLCSTYARSAGAAGAQLRNANNKIRPNAAVAAADKLPFPRT